MTIFELCKTLSPAAESISLRHGGELILENTPGGGTLVTVKLPESQ